LNSKHRTKKERKYKREVTRGMNNGDGYIYCSCPGFKDFDYQNLYEKIVDKEFDQFFKFEIILS